MVRRILAAISVSLVTLLASSGVALATSKWDVILVPIGYSNPIPDESGAVAELAVEGGCTFSTPGRLEINKKEVDEYKLVGTGEAKACGSATATEKIEKVFWRSEPGREHILVELKGGMKYRTSSPYKCTYSTPVYEDSFAPTKSRWYVKAEMEGEEKEKLVEGESESGCVEESLPVVEGVARLFYPTKNAYVNAEFRCEYFEEVC